jgi:hypothetical protein
MYEQINADGNNLIGINELNSSDIIMKLKLVETNPDLIWEAIEENFGFGFFNHIIEKEFSVSLQAGQKDAIESTMVEIKKDSAAKLKVLDE